MAKHLFEDRGSPSLDFCIYCFISATDAGQDNAPCPVDDPVEREHTRYAWRGEETPDA